MAKAKYIMYVNTGDLPAKKAEEYVEKVKKATKALQEEDTLWAFIGVRNEPTRIEALPVI